jgi:general L-amino acid transport system permease protein
MNAVLKPFEEPKAPPAQTTGVVAQLRQHFFSSWFNTLITIGLLWVTFQLASFIINWGFINAVWFGDTAKSCPDNDGACWAFVTSRWRIFVYGFYPKDLYWRVNITYFLAALTFAAFVFSFGTRTKPIRITLFIGFPISAYVFLVGGVFGLQSISPEEFGGLLLTLTIATSAIFGSIPLGLCLALGRTSNLKVFSVVCAVFIEFWRGVPHIVVIVMFVALLPIFIPNGGNIDLVVRTFIAFAVLNSAYMAEVFRGGMQSIPNGQIEASRAIGLTYWHTIGYIVLPQAIRNSIPALVNTCISIFKETTIVLLVGFSDFLGIVKLSLDSNDWLGPPHISSSAYLFAALVYFVFTFSISKYSERLENRRDINF